MRPQLRLSPGDLLQVKRLDALVGDVLVRAEGPSGRYLVAMVLGVTDKGVPFDVPEMMRALGYQPIPKSMVPDFSGIAGNPAAEKEKADEH